MDNLSTNNPSDCLYSEIDWDDDPETGRAKAVYYCPKIGCGMCDESVCSRCKYFDDGKDD